MQKIQTSEVFNVSTEIREFTKVFPNIYYYHPDPREAKRVSKFMTFSMPKIRIIKIHPPEPSMEVQNTSTEIWIRYIRRW